MNAKNQLQELCQRLGYPMPSYTQINHILNDDNSHTFIVEVTCPWGKFQGQSGNKKSASMEAASEALYGIQVDKKIVIEEEKMILNEKKNMYQLPPLESCTQWFLLDLENFPQAQQGNWHPDHFIMSFIGRYSHHYKNHLSQIASFSYPKIADSGGRDAADVLLIFQAGIMVEMARNLGIIGEFIIVSSDHFSEVLVKCLHEKGFSARTVTNLNELNALLN